MCAMARGVRDQNSVMKVDVMHGTFQKDQNLRNELLTRLKKPVFFARSLALHVFSSATLVSLHTDYPCISSQGATLEGLHRFRIAAQCMNDCGLILLAEDDENDASISRMALKKAGGLLTPSPTFRMGENAIQLPCLTLLRIYPNRASNTRCPPLGCYRDLKMSGEIQAFDLLVWIKNQSPPNCPPVIVLSGPATGGLRPGNVPSSLCVCWRAAAYFVKAKRPGPHDSFRPRVEGVVARASQPSNLSSIQNRLPCALLRDNAHSLLPFAAAAMRTMARPMPVLSWSLLPR